MSDFRFACPNCGQRISCDSSSRGAQTICPTCQKPLTVPGPPVATPAPKAAPGEPAPAMPAPAPRPASASPSFSRSTSATSSAAEISGLAVASLVCSCLLTLGCVPGIVCGHLAKTRIRRNPLLLGDGIASAGLIISYVVLVCSLGFLAAKIYERAQRRIFIRKEADELAVMTARGVDQVKIGDPDSEAEHGLKPGNSGTGVFFGRNWRGSTGGNFSYVMKVSPTRPMNLNCRYWGSDTGGRLFDILVNGHIIATQTLDRNVPDRFFDVEYKIPESLTRGKNEVTVEFRAHQGNGAGGVFGCQMLKR